MEEVDITAENTRAQRGRHPLHVQQQVAQSRREAEVPSMTSDSLQWLLDEPSDDVVTPRGMLLEWASRDHDTTLGRNKALIPAIVIPPHHLIHLYDNHLPCSRRYDSTMFKILTTFVDSPTSFSCKVMHFAYFEDTLVLMRRVSRIGQAKDFQEGVTRQRTPKAWSGWFKVRLHYQCRQTTIPVRTEQLSLKTRNIFTLQPTCTFGFALAIARTQTIRLTTGSSFSIVASLATWSTYNP